MAKLTTNLIYLSRIPFHLGFFRSGFSCKICQKSYVYVSSNSFAEFLRIRHISTNQHVFKNVRTRALNLGERDKVDDRIIPENGEKRITEQEQIIVSALEQGKIVTSYDWEGVQSAVLGRSGFINPHNFDAVAMGFCIAARQYSSGLSLLDQINASGKEANVATLSRFLKLCYVCHTAPVPTNVQEMILSLYSKLRASCSLMDANTAENVIHGLALTDKWRDAIELLPMIKLSCFPSGVAYNVLAKTAIEHDDIDTGWELLNEMLSQGRKPLPATYCALLDLCNRNADKHVGQEWVEKLLSFYIENDLRPTRDVVEKLRSWFKKLFPEWKSSMTTLNNRGTCKSCRNHLEVTAVTEEEFGALRSNFIDKVVVGSNVFLKTNPEELKNFQKFLSNAVPYDVVIDGLNVAYSAKSSRNSPHSAYVLQDVVEHFLKRSQKVVLFGRKHMQSWPRKPMNYIFSNTKTFLADNISQDDPFLLYAAMYGGLATSFVSRDLMRGHLHLLKDRALKVVFRRWQQQHQFFLLYIASQGNVVLKPPLSFNPSVQRRPDGGWHIPYDEEFHLLPPQTLNPPEQWLCLGPKPQKKGATSI